MLVQPDTPRLIDHLLLFDIYFMMNRGLQYSIRSYKAFTEMQLIFKLKKKVTIKQSIVMIQNYNIKETLMGFFYILKETY